MASASRNLVMLMALAAAPLAAQGAPAAVTLAQALQMSERVQPSIVTAQGQVRSSEARVRAAKGAFLPSLSASSSGSRGYSEGPQRIDPVTQQLVSGNSSSQNVGFGFSSQLTIFDGFRRNHDLKVAHANEDAADASLIDARFQNGLTTTNAFFDALAAQQTLRVRAASVTRAEEQLKVAIAKLQTGSATRSDSLQSLVTLGTARLNLLQANSTLATSEATLGRLVGSNDRVSAIEDSSIYRIASIDTTALRAEAVALSPRVKNFEATATAARASYSSSKATYFPTLSASFSNNWNGNRSNDYQFFQGRNLGLQLSWQLFNGFTREQNIANAAVAVDNAEAQAADARRQVLASLTQRLAELGTAQQQIEILNTSVQAANEDIRVVTERYKLGVATIVDVLTSQERLTQAEIDAVTARFNYLRAKAQIEALIGRSLQ
ncbi:MAG: TolC family protein [Gemmatimonadota bacterium]